MSKDLWLERQHILSEKLKHNRLTKQKILLKKDLKYTKKGTKQQNLESLWADTPYSISLMQMLLPNYTWCWDLWGALYSSWVGLVAMNVHLSKGELVRGETILPKFIHGTSSPLSFLQPSFSQNINYSS